MAKAKKKEIGLGIRALLTNFDEQVEENQEMVVKELSHSVAMIPLNQIEVNPFQPRTDFDEEALQELANSLKTHGLIQPLTVRRMGHNQYQLISGERRLRASKLAGLEEVPAYVRIANDQEMLEMALVENIQRQDLNAIEVAITYQRLIDECDLTHENLSDRVGKKRSSVSNYLRLLRLPPEIQNSIKKGDLSMGHARALAGVDDLGVQLLIFKKTLNEALSVRAVEQLISQYSKDKIAPKKEETSGVTADYKRVEDQFRQFFGVKKLQLKLKRGGKGQIVIPFNSTAELNRMIDVLEPEV